MIQEYLIILKAAYFTLIYVFCIGIYIWSYIYLAMYDFGHVAFTTQKWPSINMDVHVTQ